LIGLQFTAAEAAIRPFVKTVRFFSWMLPILGLQGVSNLVGIIEVTTAFLMAARPWSAFASVLGSASSNHILITLSFFLTTQRNLSSISGLSAIGQF